MEHINLYIYIYINVFFCDGKGQPAWKEQAQETSNFILVSLTAQTSALGCAFIIELLQAHKVNQGDVLVVLKNHPDRKA